MTGEVRKKKKILSLEASDQGYFDVPGSLEGNGINPDDLDIYTAKLYTGEKDKPAAKAFLAWVIKNTSQKDFDLIILEDKEGVGLQSADAIAGPSRVRTIVMHGWTFDPNIEKQYREKGYFQFMNRIEVDIKLRNFLD